MTEQYVNPPVTVSGIITDQYNRVLVGLRKDNRKSDIPGGFLEAGETLEEALEREILEECGISISGFQIRYFTSFCGQYHDGRQLVSVYFVVPTPEPERWMGLSSPELLITWWEKGIPENMNSEVDRKALESYFGGVN